jgi:hypothetical protein
MTTCPCGTPIATPPERIAVMAYIDRITDQSGGATTRAQLEAFTFHGHAIKLIDPSRGIRNPAMLPATLSILTNPRSGYADQAGPDGFPRHSIRTGDWAHARLPQTPRSLRTGSPDHLAADHLPRPIRLGRTGLPRLGGPRQRAIHPRHQQRTAIGVPLGHAAGGYLR